MSNIDDSFLCVVKASVKEHVESISDEALNMICESISETAGGEVVYISKSYSRMLSVRNKNIMEARRSGATTDSLAVKFSLSKSHINKILRES